MNKCDNAFFLEQLGSSHVKSSYLQKAAIFLILTGFFLCASGGALAQHFAPHDSSIRTMIKDAQIADGQVLDQLIAEGKATIRIVLAEGAFLDSESGETVNPTVVELVNLFSSSRASLDATGALVGTVDDRGLLAVVRNPGVLAVELANASESASAVTPKGVCYPNSTTACFHGKFQVRVNGPWGPYAGVAATSSSSATFYFGSSSNWEVMAKVLDACYINSRYWVFSGKATTQSFSVSVLNTQTGQAKSYGSSPATDTTTFLCN